LKRKSPRIHLKNFFKFVAVLIELWNGELDQEIFNKFDSDLTLFNK
jgi:hypothetical protein